MVTEVNAMQTTTPPRVHPPMPPPRFVPDFCHNKEMLSPKLLSKHLHHYVYIWLASGHEFWMFPLEMDGNSMSGYIWDGGGWIRYVFDSRLIHGLY